MCGDIRLVSQSKVSAFQTQSLEKADTYQEVEFLVVS